jgi:hypothetical protein
MLGRIRRVESAHAGPLRSIAGDQLVDELPTHFEHVSVMHTDVIRFGKVDEFIESLYEMGMDFQKQMGKRLIEMLDQACEQAGTAIDAQGRPLSWDMVLELIEAIEVRFDAAGMMSGEPAIMMNPQTAAALSNIPRPDDFEQRVNDILRKKLEKHLAQKRNRQLSE